MIANPRSYAIPTLSSHPKDQDVSKTPSGRDQPFLVKSHDLREGLGLALGSEGTIHYYQPGDQVLTEGEHADAVYIILQGAVVAVWGQGNTRVEMTRLGPGQCFGELGVIYFQRRKASILTETALTVLRIDATLFRERYDADLSLQDLFATLQLAYTLKSGKRLEIFWGRYDGQSCISTIYGDVDEDRVIATTIPREDRLLITHSQKPEISEKIEFFSDKDGRRRELHLTDVERNERGGITSGLLVGAAATQVKTDLGHLYQPLLSRTRLSAAVLGRFRRTGYLGYTSERPHGLSICHCLRLGEREVLSAAYDQGPALASVQQATGIGLICAACKPAVQQCLVSRAALCPSRFQKGVDVESPASTRHESGDYRQEGTSRGSQHTRLKIRPYNAQFDMTALMGIREVVEVHLLSIASLFSSPSERFMIRTITPLLSTIEDQTLAAHVEDFLTHESQHIVAHEKLNRLLLEEIYPANPALARLHEKLPACFENLPIQVKLSICAAAEFFAVSLFTVFFERFYHRGRTYHSDPSVNDGMKASGIAQLFHWHASEEFEHRHVAFDLMRSLNTPYIVRMGGYLLLGCELARLTTLTANALRKECGIGLRAYLKLMFHDSTGLVRTLRKVGKYCRPGFTHAKISDDFLQHLEMVSAPKTHD